MNSKSIFLFFFFIIFLVCSLSAQHRDTVYVERETVTYDTITVYDTVRVHDTLNIADYLRSEEFERLFYSSEYVDNLSLTDSMKEKLLRQTVTFWESSVFKDEQQTFSSMDSIKKYGLAGLIILGLNAMSPAQTDSTAAGTAHNPKQKKIYFLENPTNGFHLGYTIQYDLIEPIVHLEIGEAGEKITHSPLLHGFHAGAEFSYNFANYFGVSAALNIGTVGFYETITPTYHTGTGPIYKRLYKAKYGLSVPLKFEFHYPIRDNLLFTVSAGARVRTPISAFVDGFSSTEGNVESERNSYLSSYSVYDRKMFYADILLDAGLYYQLPNEDYLRFSVGLNAATTIFMAGTVTLASPHEGVVVILPPGEYVQSSHRNNHLYFQIAYIQSFNKQRRIMRAQPHWSTEVGMHNRHEIRFEVGDPLGIMVLQKKSDHSPYLSGLDHALETVGYAWRATPVFSLNYHYRLTKWLWVGAMVNYTYYKDHTDYTYPFWSSRILNCITLMPELRFSYLNRPHVTLYSAAALGLTLFLNNQIDPSPSTYPTFQLTAFGVRVGGEHLFGTFELGAGIKGVASAGIGYAF